jgi:hypothetical protein
VISTPEGAEVEIDDNFIGGTPFTIEIHEDNTGCV